SPSPVLSSNTIETTATRRPSHRSRHRGPPRPQRHRTRLRRREAMARPGHPLGRTRLDLPRWSSPPRDHPVAQPRALETCPRDRPEVRLLVRRGSGVLVGEVLARDVYGVLTQMVVGVGIGGAYLAVACGFDDAIADEAAAVLAGVLGSDAHALGDLAELAQLLERGGLDLVD